MAGHHCTGRRLVTDAQLHLRRDETSEVNEDMVFRDCTVIVEAKDTGGGNRELRTVMSDIGHCQFRCALEPGSIDESVCYFVPHGSADCSEVRGGRHQCC